MLFRSARREEASSSKDAQQRFGNAKSISSAAYFNDNDKEGDQEKQSRLAQFQVRQESWKRLGLRCGVELEGPSLLGLIVEF